MHEISPARADCHWRVRLVAGGDRTRACPGASVAFYDSGCQRCASLNLAIDACACLCVSARRQAVDELEPQGAYGFERPSVGIFQGAIAFCQSGFDLEVGQEVVRENDELLPGTIGVVIVCGNGIETESGLEFPYGFLVQAATCHETPERAQLEGEIGGHRTVFEGAIIGIEQVQLVVLAGGMHDAFSKDGNVESTFPFLDGER